MRYRRPAILVVCVLVVIGLLWQFGGAPGSDRSGGGPPRGDGERTSIAVEVADVERRDITDRAFYTGTLQPGTQFMLASKAGGRLRNLLVDIGDLVAPGQVIARLDDEEFIQDVAEQRAARDVAEAQLEDARAQRQVRQRAYERVADLRRRNLSSESEYDIARSERDAAVANVRVAEAQVAQREAALRAAEVRLDYTTIRAEWNGETVDRVRFVGERFVDEGANISANDPLISVIDVDTLRGVMFVTDADFARLEVGQIARVRSDARPGEVFEGRVHRIAPLLQEDSRQARVEIRIPNSDRRLSPGFFVGIEVDLEEVEGAIVVPEDAVTRKDGRRGVYLIEDPDSERVTVSWVPITEGVRSEGLVQVLEPEISGQVVTLGQHRLSDGAAVRIAN